MVREIRLYIEGGGDGSATKGLLREGFSKFFGEIAQAARSRRIKWEIIICGGREQTFDAFCTAVDKHPDSFNVLIVDSEDPLHGNVWEHLEKRDKWDRPGGATDEQCYLMVQNMETWFIADVDALQRFYGQGFNANRLPRTQNLEGVARIEIERALEEATRHTQKRRYHKIQHGSVLLARIDPLKVRRLPNCDRIFTTLLRKIQEDA